MKIIDTKFKGLKIISHRRHSDSRGSLRETYIKKIIKWDDLVFDYATISKKNVLRGLHGDIKSWKLVTCVFGEVFQVVVDTRPESKNYLKWESWKLSDENRKQILIPPNFANGFLCLSEKCVYHYKYSYSGEYNDVENQFTMKWNDPQIGIKWPIKEPILSKRDK